MKISTRSLYAVMALVDVALAREQTLISLPDIARRQGISLAYLEQIFMILRKKELVRSMRGQKGGYVLNRQANHISIAEILAAMGEAPKVTRCRGKGTQGSGFGCLPEGAQCLTHHLWVQLEGHIENYLASVSLADICAQNVGKKVLPPKALESLNTHPLENIACLS